MKKITIFTRQLKKIGGIERFVTTIAEMFARDYEVELVVNYGASGEKTAFEVPCGVTVRYLSPKEPNEVSLKKLILSGKFFSLPGELSRRREIKREQNNAYKIFLATLKTDYIITDRSEYNFLIQKHYHGDAIQIATDHNFHQNDSKYISSLLNSISGFNYLVVASQELESFYKNKTPTRVIYIPNPLSFIPEKKSRLDTKNLVSIGRFVPEKDFFALIDVMQKVHVLDPKITLTVVGDGPERAQIEERVDRLGLRSVVSFPGFLSQKQIADILYKSSLYVMTSKTEAFGLVLTEAMSYGLPCIAFDRASGARSLLSENLGVLIKNSDTDKMATKIVELLTDYETLKKLQGVINDKIGDFSVDTIRKQWMRILS